MDHGDWIRLLVGVVAAVTAAIIAVLGWLVNHYLARRIQRLQMEIALVDRQICQPYGPLHTTNIASKKAVDSMRSWLGIVEDDSTPLSDDQMAGWVFWMEHILAPLNQQREKLIQNSLHLITEKEVPEVVNQFLEHAIRCRIMVMRWKVKDYSVRRPGTPFPKDFDSYARSSVAMLKERHAHLYEELGMDSAAVLIKKALDDLRSHS